MKLACETRDGFPPRDGDRTVYSPERADRAPGGSAGRRPV